jgi:hypothetical protein
MRSECGGRLLILPHEATVAVNVGAQDGGELALHTQPGRIIPPATPCVKSWLRVLDSHAYLPSLGLKGFPNSLLNPILG